MRIRQSQGRYKASRRSERPATRTAASHSVVLGVDGSPQARRATAFLARLAHHADDRVTVVAVLEPINPPSLGLLPASARRRIAAELSRLDRAARERVQRRLDAAADTLAGAGWRVRTTLRSGAPLRELLAAAEEARADMLVIGARGTGGLERFILGSVADGCLKRAALPVLIVK